MYVFSYFSNMQEKKGPGLLFASLQSIASVTIGSAIADLGRIAPRKEAIFLGVGIAFLIASLTVFYKYKLGNRINPAITNPKVRGFLSRYPLFPPVVGMLAGILVMVFFLRVLGDN